MGPGIAVLFAGALTAVADLAKGKAPPPRVIIGTGLAGLAVLGLASWSPPAARAMGGVILLTSLITNGYDVAAGIGKVTA